MTESVLARLLQFPKDWRVHGLVVDPKHHTLEIVVENENFPVTPPGELLPVIWPLYKWADLPAPDIKMDYEGGMKE